MTASAPDSDFGQQNSDETEGEVHDATPDEHSPDEHARDARDADGFVPLRSYAAIGDGRTVALIATDGTIDWLPIPALDSPPTFAAMLDPQNGGRLTMRPVGPARAERHYEAGTNVLITTWTTPTGTCEVTDAMVTGVAGRLPWAEIGRRTRGVTGTVTMEWTVEAGTMLATATPQLVVTENGPVITVDGVTIAAVENGCNLEHDDRPRFFGTFDTGVDSTHILTIVGTLDEPVFIPDPANTIEGIDRAIDNWKTWSKVFSYDGPWADAVERSALALKLLIYSPTGAIAAAATTSLPENLNGGKNWDYRFAWIRDLSYTVRALNRFGLREETHAAVSWLMRTIDEHDDTMPIFFRLDGSKADSVHTHDSPGWKNIGPVLDGNRASGQLQLGVWGDVFEVMRQYVRQGNVLDRRTASVLQMLADSACKQWEKPDSGMWELEATEHYVSSKMGCWQALDAAIDLYDQGFITGPRERWDKNRRLIREWVDDNGWSEERGAYVMYPGSDALDTSVLLHAQSGFDRGERMQATIAAIRDELGVGPLIYRYTGMREEEAPFVACSFWLASALAHTGALAEARALMDDMVTRANDVGLFSEMISEETGELLGNMPQGLSHLALIQAALTIEHLEDENAE